jgi:hypothetical protein
MHMAEMPVTPGAVQRECPGDPCLNSIHWFADTAGEVVAMPDYQG